MKFFSRKSRRAVSPKLRTAKPRMVQLEDRLTPAGFSFEDGAYIIVESLGGSYKDVKIQPTDQKIVAAGLNNGGVLISRFDSQGQIDTAYGSGGSSNPSLGTGTEMFPDLVLQSDGKRKATNRGERERKRVREANLCRIGLSYADHWEAR